MSVSTCIQYRDKLPPDRSYSVVKQRPEFFTKLVYKFLLKWDRIFTPCPPCLSSLNFGSCEHFHFLFEIISTYILHSPLLTRPLSGNNYHTPRFKYLCTAIMYKFRQIIILATAPAPPADHRAGLAEDAHSGCRQIFALHVSVLLLSTSYSKPADTATVITGRNNGRTLCQGGGVGHAMVRPTISTHNRPESRDKNQY